MRRRANALRNLTERVLQRLAADIHDSLGQELVALQLHIAGLVQRQQKDVPVTDLDLICVARIVDRAMVSAQQISRGMAGVSRDEGGVRVALRELADRITGETNVACHFEVDGCSGRLDKFVIGAAAVDAYRIAQEATANALRHARASAIFIALREVGNSLSLIVTDNGCGFETAAPRVQTGLVVIDTLFAIGRGQRELIIGDRAVGKTTLAVDTLINQRSSDLVCVYVSVGQKSSSVRRVLDAIKAYGTPERSIVIVAPPSSSPGLQWIAPFAAFTMAEHFRDRGQHALIVIDDLTKHAASHREIALLTRQSPGREAYPGDVFYVHARLLERAAKLSKQKGGGSLTALPIAETDAGNLSAYIPTNLISITDGQIVLDERLFHEGQKPAVDVGTSVSRVGGKTQAQALRKAADTLRLDYAQFLELETFTRFGGMPDARVRDQLTRGARIRAILSQPQHAPLPLADEVALVQAVQSGLLDPLPLSAITKFRQGLHAELERTVPDSVRQIETTGALDAAAKQALQRPWPTTHVRWRRLRCPDHRGRRDRAARRYQRADRGHRSARRSGERNARYRRGARSAGKGSARRRG
jgi:proton translocating ATP synthase F1 alpha subunit